MTVQSDEAVQLCGLHGSYQKIAESTQEGERITAWLSRDSQDASWDRFLEQTPLGQFQQSTLWARTKAVEGWSPVRALIFADHAAIAGFQILVRPAWRGLGRIGYVSKGPVVLPGRRWAARYTAELLRQVVRQQRLAALVVQPPDLCGQMPNTLKACGFMPDFLMKVNDATWIVDRHEDFQAMEAVMSRTTRKLVRRASATGITMRQGGREDLARFFELMLETCRRQNASPNPSQLGHLQALWDAASPSGNIRLYLAQCQERVLAGGLVILFGATATLWKIGAAPPDEELKPNAWLVHQAIRWAHEHGYRQCDFAAFDRGMARSILSGEPLSEYQKQSRYFFLTRFGGRPSLLPGAQVYFPNPLLRAAWRFCFRRRLH